MINEDRESSDFLSCNSFAADKKTERLNMELTQTHFGAGWVHFHAVIKNDAYYISVKR